MDEEEDRLPPQIIKDYASFLGKIIIIMTGFIFTSLIFYLSSLQQEIDSFDAYIISILFALFILLLILTVWTLRIERRSMQHVRGSIFKKIREKTKKKYGIDVKPEDIERVESEILDTQVSIVNIITFVMFLIFPCLLFIAILIKFKLAFIIVLYPSIFTLSIVILLLTIRIRFNSKRKNFKKEEKKKKNFRIHVS